VNVLKSETNLKKRFFDDSFWNWFVFPEMNELMEIHFCIFDIVGVTFIDGAFDVLYNIWMIEIGKEFRLCFRGVCGWRQSGWEEYFGFNSSFF
jgi:hypothetical protein